MFHEPSPTDWYGFGGVMQAGIAGFILFYFIGTAGFPYADFFPGGGKGGTYVPFNTWKP